MNMRKIIAVLSAVLMLCSIIPMAALSVSAAGSFDFENGTVSGWQSSCTIEVVDDNGSKVLKWDASGANWANVYYYGSSMVSANTDYVVSFRAKADRSTNMNFKVNNNWAGDTAKLTVDVTTEWQEYSEVLNSGACTSGALLLFSSNTYASSGATYYIDDIVIEEYVEPAETGVIINGDFETGDSTGWTTHQSTTISADAAYTGSYGAHLVGNGGWGGMLNQTVPVEAGKSYEISMWVKTNAVGCNIQIKDGSDAGSSLGNAWFSTTSWTQKTWTVIPSTEGIFINFCGGGNGSAEDVYVDDVTVTELKDPSYDGYLYNGDFETGKASPWTTYQSTTVSADAAYSGDYGIALSGAGASWGGTAYQDITVEVGKTYIVWMYAKAVTQGVNIQIQNPVGTNVATKYISGTSWAKYAFEFTATSTTARINTCCSGISGTDLVYMDDVFVFEKQDPTSDGYITNGNFESGALDGLTPYQSTNVSREAAKDGNFGLHMSGSGGWGSFGLWTISTLEVGAQYKLSYDYKAVSVGANWTLWQDSTSSGTKYGSGWISKTDWTTVTLDFTAASTTAVLNFNGGGNGTAENVYLDNLTITLVKCAECTYDSCEDAVCDVCGSEREAGTCVSDAEYECTDGVCTVCGAAVAGTGHSYYYACDAYCEICYELTNESAAHSITHVEAVAATCTVNGNIEYWTCEYCGGCWDNENGTGMPLNRMMVIEWASHTYDDDYDVDCNVCGDIRVVEYEVSSFGGNSISEDVSGLAYKFDVAVDGMGIKAGKYTQADYTNATVTPNSESGALKLIGMGAVVSNNWGITYLDYVDGAHVVDVPVVYLCDLEADSASYAVRVINIPESAYDTYITARPYYVYEDAEGNEVVVYGYEEMATYNGVLEG